ncbi:MAG: C2H2-type zinc finger protein [Candidatus Hodarchaeales archaeon]
MKQVQSDFGIIQNKIKEVVFERKHTGIKLKILKDDFYRVRGYPIVVDLTIIDNIVLENCKKKTFVLRDSHARLYFGSTPKHLNDDFLIFDKNFKDVPRYKCGKCQMEFDTEDLLDVHKRNYHPEFICPRCSQIFEYATELQTHIDNEHVIRKYKCEFCDEAFKEESELFLHVKKSHEIPRFLCPICNNSFSSGIDLQEHITEMHESYECKICGKRLKTEEMLSKYFLELQQGICFF